MDWENVIDWEAVNKLTDEQVSAILDMFDKQGETMDNYTPVDKHTCGHALSIDLFGSWTTWICTTCKTKRVN